MNIVRVTIKNFLSLADVEIKPGKITQIIGDNGAGKTTILKSIDFAVHGSNDPSLIKIGEDSSEVLVELSDGTLIRRRLNSQGKQSVDVSRDGMKATSPQSQLAVLFDSNFFNPLELLDPKKRDEAIMSSIDLKLDENTLAAAIGVEPKDLPELDYSMHGLKVLDICYKYFYQRRAEANKDAADKKKRWETYKADFKGVDAPKMQRKEIDLRRQSCITIVAHAQNHVERVKRQEEEYKKAKEKIEGFTAEREKIMSSISAYENTISTLDFDTNKKVTELLDEVDRKVEELRSQCERKKGELQQTIATEKGRVEASKKFIEDAEAQLKKPTEEVTPFVHDKTEAEKELEQLKAAEMEIEAYEATERSRTMIEGMEREFQVSEAFAQAIDNRVQLLNGKIKKDLMASAEMPIEGLQYVDSQFLIGGVSVDNLNTAAQMKLAVSVARKKSKRTKIICVDGAESLDPNTWQAFLNETKDDGFTYFVTKVGAPHLDPGGTIVPMQKGQVIQ